MAVMANIGNEISSRINTLRLFYTHTIITVYYAMGSVQQEQHTDGTVLGIPAIYHDTHWASLACNMICLFTELKHLTQIPVRIALLDSDLFRTPHLCEPDQGAILKFEKEKS